MNKNLIKRTDLKNNFLKQTIIRIDYDYLFDNYIQKTMENLDSFMGELGYKIKNSMQGEFGLKVDFGKIINDNNANLMDNICVENEKREKIFSFVNDNKNIRIDITRNYLALTIEYNEYIHFDEIKEIFNRIVDELKKVREHLSITRTGLRKINTYIIDKLEDINKYFEEDTLYYSPSKINELEIFGKQCLETFKYKNYMVNQITNISQGILTKDNEDSNVYQFILDFDIYIEQPENDEINLQEMNDNLFNLYKNALKENFLEDLQKEDIKMGGIYKI